MKKAKPNRSVCPEHDRPELHRRELLGRGIHGLMLLGCSMQIAQGNALGAIQDALGATDSIPKHEGKGVGYFAPRKLDMKFGMKFKSNDPQKNDRNIKLVSTTN